jgi:hypothetical protein
MTGDRRKAKRTPFSRTGAIYTRAGKKIAPCMLHDVSHSGARLRLQSNCADLPNELILSFSPDGKVRRNCAVVWRTEAEVGVSFSATPGADDPRGASGVRYG